MLKSRIRKPILAVVAALPALALPALGLAVPAGAASAATSASSVVSARSAVSVSTVTPAPAPLNGISCTSASFCMAVGATTATMSTGVAAESWDGHHWHRLAIPKPGGVSFVALTAVSCPSASECVAVGWGTRSGNQVPVAEAWTRSGGWTAGQPVVPARSGDSRLNAISCPTTATCFAAGVAGEFTSLDVPLVERWQNGTWTRLRLPQPGGASTSVLWGISCKSATQCAAVGSYDHGSTQYGLIERLSRTTWSAIAAPRSASGSLFAVSCATTTHCVAVGSTGAASLAETLNGSTWTQSIAPSPRGAHSFPSLASVSCASATHCVAVGNTVFASNTAAAYVDTLTGTTWRETAQTGSSFRVGQLAFVSCFSTATSTASCAAVGGTTAISATMRPLSAFLTGSRWTVVLTV